MWICCISCVFVSAFVKWSFTAILFGLKWKYDCYFGRMSRSLGDFEKYYWNQSALINCCLLFVRFSIHFLIRSLIHFFSHRKCKRQMHFSLNHFLLWLAYVQLKLINCKLELNLLDLSKSLPWASADQVSVNGTAQILVYKAVALTKGLQRFIASQCYSNPLNTLMV